ncbi:MAG: hypothetical protein J6X55_03660 [Victivallales bacterium]|nr:hypothetical protein [Victivallales bacterium]
MKLKQVRCILCMLCLSLISFVQATPKLIDWSWSNPGLDYLEQNLPRMKEECPFLDGLVLRIYGKTIEIDGKKWTAGTGNAWNKRAWSFDMFEDTITRFKKLDFGHFTDNFFYMTTSSVNFDWESDEDCAVMAANFGVAARVAREIGLKGLGVDIEEYGKRFWHFSDFKTDKTFSEYSAIVFTRGQQWGRAVFAEYPDVALLMPFCLTMSSAELSIPFMNGVIDVMPITATIFEGHESSGYISKFPTDYANMQMHIRKLISQVVRPENVNRARGQIRLAPAFYLDAYFNDNEAKNYYVNSLEPERSELGPIRLFTRNILAAMQEADPYIWIYGEKACWWKNSAHPKAKRTWDEMPKGAGVAQALNAVGHPLDGLDVTRETNLVKDPTFQGKEKIWNLWQREYDQKKPAPGDGAVKDGKCVMHKISRGCFTQGAPVKEGSMYFFYCKGGVNDVRGGIAAASLCFQDANHKWMSHAGNISLKLPVTGKEEIVWTYLVAPKNAAFVSIQCGASGQSEGGEAFFTEMLLEER